MVRTVALGENRISALSFMRIITIASCAMFVSGLFKITEPKIVYSIKNNQKHKNRVAVTII